MASASIRGSDGSEYASSSDANAKRSTAPGQRPSRSGYVKGASQLPPVRSQAQATASAAARHGLSAFHTFPSTATRTTMPTQNVT